MTALTLKREFADSIAILIPCFNQQEELEQAIFSIGVDLKKIAEVVVVDDGSEPPIRLRNPLDKLGNIKLIRLDENRGISAALNIGLRNTKSRFIHRFDCDDFWVEGRIDAYMEIKNKNKYAAIISCFPNAFSSSEHNRITENYISKPKIPFFIKLYSYFGSPLVHPAVMYDRYMLGDFKYSEMHSGAEDFELFRRIITFKNTVVIPESYLRYRVDGVDKDEKRGKFRSLKRIERANRIFLPLIDDLRVGRFFHLLIYYFRSLIMKSIVKMDRLFIQCS